MSDNEMDEKSDIEKLREKNLQEREAFLSSFMDDPFFADTIKGLNLLKAENRNDPKVTNKRKRGDSSFRFTGAIPNERRSSARLLNKKPDYSYLDLPDEKDVVRDSDSLDGIEDVVYRVKKSRKPSSRATPAVIIPVEEITERMIKDIKISGNKVYGPGGSSCHQCRQKTVDTKTVCRSGFCIGVRGQFCGICVINRYGEDPAAALKDPNWRCYVCRGCCNCSFCRIKEGKRPTGILVPLARSHGYNSVLEFLISLNGYGDFAEPEKNPDNLLGFDGNFAVMGGNKRIELKSDFPAGLQGYDNCTEPGKDPDLLGFDGDFAVTRGNERIQLKSDFLEWVKEYGKYVEPERDPDGLLGFDGHFAVLAGNNRIDLKSD